MILIMPLVLSLAKHAQHFPHETLFRRRFLEGQLSLRQLKFRLWLGWLGAFAVLGGNASASVLKSV